MRTAISQFSFALIILRIFTSEFYAIGALFAAYGIAIMLVAIHRRFEGNRQFFDSKESDDESSCADDDDDDDRQYDRCRQRTRNGNATHQSGRGQRRHRTIIVKKFRTSANSIALLTGLSLGAYTTLMVLIWRLDE